VFSLRDAGLFSANPTMLQQSSNSNVPAFRINNNHASTPTNTAPTFHQDDWRGTAAAVSIISFDTNPAVQSKGWFLDEVFTIAQQPTISSNYTKSEVRVSTGQDFEFNFLRNLPPGAPRPASQSFEFDVSCSGNLFKGAVCSMNKTKPWI
jgi:hypothetical protein